MEQNVSYETVMKCLICLSSWEASVTILTAYHKKNQFTYQMHDEKGNFNNQ